MLFKAIPDIKNIEKWQALELPFEYNDFMYPWVLDDKAEVEGRIKLYNSLHRDRSYDTLHGPFLDIAVHSPDPKIRAVSDSRIRQACDIAVALKAGGIVLHTNLIPNFYNEQYRQNWLDSNQEYFKSLIKEYKNLNFYMENMFDEEPDSLCKLASKIADKQFGICLDIGHCNISKTNIWVWTEALDEYVMQYHINDNDGRTDGHLPVGDGNTDWEKVFRLLNGNAPAVIEVPDYSSFIKSRDFISKNSYCF